MLFRVLDLYDKDKVDIEHVSMEDVFVLLQCDDKGLTEEEAARRIGIFGPNKASRVSAWHTPSLSLQPRSVTYLLTHF
jgi:H+-transporting ATPase